MPFNIIPNLLLEKYKLQEKTKNLELYKKLIDSELSIDSFSFYTSVAATYSSKMEGEEIELDSYIKHKSFGINFKPDYQHNYNNIRLMGIEYEKLNYSMAMPFFVMLPHALKN